MLTIDFAREFTASSGSIVGRDHARAHRAPQDACMIHVCSEGVALAVADGCSSGRATEVGAALAATWIARNAFAAAHASPAERVAHLERGLLAYLRAVATALSPSDATWPATVHDFFLCSLLGAVVTASDTVVFGAGDGLYAIDGATTVLDPGPDNAPDYLAYALVDRPSSLRIHAVVPTASLTSLVLATDGAIPLTTCGELDAMARDPRYAKNASLLRKRLVVLGAIEKRLHDDTAIALLARRGA